MPTDVDGLDLARRCAAVMWAGDEASRRAGVRLDPAQVEPGRALARLTVEGRHVNGHGIAHGGFVFLLADTAFALACNTADVVTVAQACDIVFLAPAHLGDELVATAAERARAGRSAIYDVTVTRGDGEVVAEFRGRSRTTGARILREGDRP